MRRACFVLILSLACYSAAGQGASELDFVTGLTEHQNIRKMLPSYMQGEALKLLDARRQEIGRLGGPDQVAARKAQIRNQLLEVLGGLPERTPLNARIVGALERPNYRIEKVVFESQPGFFVTGNLYLPKQGAPPYPGVLFPLGHEPGGKAYPIWQQMLGALAQKGYVALTWDPVGQGERTQLWDDDLGRPKLLGSTLEHTVIGIQCLLLGDNLARYTIWDGMRALDYLLSRPEVDASRIACTGNSGGGTHTAYLAALDDRIQVAAPSCYLTNWSRLLTSIGPQDAEQNLPPWIYHKLDHPDFIHAFAPKPYLILSAIRDFFSISGARETYREARRIYGLLGAEEKIHMVDADDGHGYSEPRRLAAYSWFGKWLKGAEDNSPEPEVELATAEELNCTPTGQVLTSLKGETLYTLNGTRADAARSRRREWTGGARREAWFSEIRRLLAFEPGRTPPPAWPYGAIKHSGYSIEKWLLESEPGILIPSLFYMPESSRAAPAVVYADSRGKSAAHEEAEELVRAGFSVLSIDLRGLGETRTVEATKGSNWNEYFGDYDSAMTGLLMNRPLVGMRAFDVQQAVNILAARSEIDPGRIHAIGRGSAAVPVLVEALFDERIQKVVLDAMLVSFDAAVRARAHRQIFENVARGALQVYDLPELAAALGPRPAWIVDAADPMGRTLDRDEAEKQGALAGQTVRIRRRRPEEPLSQAYLEALK